MARQLIKEDRLLEILNGELVRYDACVECRFKTIVPLTEPDGAGCNWSHANLNCRGYPAAVSQTASLCQPSIVCQPIVTSVIADAKKKYNIR